MYLAYMLSQVELMRLERETARLAAEMEKRRSQSFAGDTIDVEAREVPGPLLIESKT